MDKEEKYKNIESIKLALAIRQLEHSEVRRDGYDIDEEGVEGVLKEYGIFNTWTDGERAILKEHLIDMAFREEVREAERWANSDPVLAFIPLMQQPKKQSKKILEPTHTAGQGE